MNSCESFGKGFKVGRDFWCTLYVCTSVFIHFFNIIVL